MVKFWDEALKKAIKKTKYRIQVCEKHGMGNSTIQEKTILKKQERQQELRK